MIDDIKAVLTDLMMKLPFVQWDRYVEHLEEAQQAVFYGWIARDDGKFDFVLVSYYSKYHPFWADCISYSTSSKRYSPELSRILLGREERPEAVCKRIEYDFPDVKNVIRLNHE